MISIREVAQLAGVSASTVSRVMNGTAKVDPEKRERVLRVIEETGLLRAEEELQGAKKVLSAAAMTYVAAMFSSLMSLLRLILIANRGRRR